MEEGETGHAVADHVEQKKVVGRQRRKVRSCVPHEGVDLAMGQTGELAGEEPVTFGRLFQQIAQRFPDVAALKWKEVPRGGEGGEMVWRTATYTEYYKSCVSAAKSFLKVVKS